MLYNNNASHSCSQGYSVFETILENVPSGDSSLKLIFLKQRMSFKALYENIQVSSTGLLLL